MPDEQPPTVQSTLDTIDHVLATCDASKLPPSGAAAPTVTELVWPEPDSRRQALIDLAVAVDELPTEPEPSRSRFARWIRRRR